MVSSQKTVSRLRSGETPLGEVIDLLHDTSIVVRANALEALIPHVQHDDRLLEQLKAAVVEPENQVRLVGTISVAHVALGCLLRVGGGKATEVAKSLIDTWPEPDRTDLLWYLRSEGLLNP